ncbi:MAG: threonine/serine exporter family protein [Holophagales bacterium]|nr:threonine/serine exporter family protein [Holophagales bacterium]
MSQEAAEVGSAVTLVERLGRALHAFGSSSPRLEAALDLLSRRLGLHGQFFSTPTALFASFVPLDDQGRARGELEPRTALLRVEPGEVNLEKLSELDAILGQVVRGELEPGRALERVDGVVERPHRYGRWLTFAAFALASGGAARFFGGGPRECLAATVIGLFTGLLAWVMEKLPNAGRLYETVAALFAAFLATAAAAWIGPLSFYVVTVAALIVLVPSMTLTLAMTELATRNLVSGSSRLAGAVLMFMTIGVGFAVGSRLGTSLFGAPAAVVPPPQPWWTEPLALAVTAGALLVLFRAHPRDYGWFVLAAAVAIVGSRGGAELLGPQVGAALGAVLVGVGSNLVARLRDRPAAITQMPGLMLLVPGSLGFRSVTALVAQDTLSGVQTAFTVVLVAISLVTGLLLANVLVPPRRVF